MSQYDIIDVRDKSLNTMPFQIARETSGDRPIPSWLQVVGERQRILVHQLPERAQIDVPLHGAAHRRVLLEVIPRRRRSRDRRGARVSHQRGHQIADAVEGERNTC